MGRNMRNLGMQVVVLLLCAPLGHAQRQDDLFTMSLSDLMNVRVVTANRITQDVADIPASVVVIDRQEIRRRGYTTLVEILQHIPGFFLVNQYNWSGVTGFGVRGYFTEGAFAHVVILVDGCRVLREGYINQYVLARIAPPVEAIDRIEVIRGPMSVTYGQDAFFGAVNIITWQRDKGRPEQVAAAWAGAGGERGVAVRAERARPDLSFVFNAALRHDGGIDVPYRSMTRNPPVTLPGGHSTSYLRSVGLADDAVTGGQLAASGGYASLGVDYRGLRVTIAHAADAHGTLWRAPSSSPDGSPVRIYGSDVSAQYELPLGGGWSLTGYGQYADYRSSTLYRLNGDDHFGESFVHSAILYGALDLHSRSNRRLNLSGGLSVERMSDAGDDVDIPAIPNVGNSSWRLKDGDAIHSAQAYVQLRWRPWPRLLLVGGGRLIRFGDFTYQRLRDRGGPGFAVEEKRTRNERPSLASQLAAIVRLGERHAVKGLLGTAVTVPNLRQYTTRLDFALAHPGVDIRQLPELQPAHITTLEMQYLGSPWRQGSVSLSLFANFLQKLIVSSGTVLPDGRYVVVTQNSGRIRTLGAEAGVKARPLPSLDLDVGLCLQRSRNREPGFAGIAVPYSPGLLANASAVWRLTPDVSASLGGIFVGRMESSWQWAGPDPQLGRRVSDAVPAYLSVDANFRVERLFGSRLFLSLHGSNLFGADIRYPADPGNAWADKGLAGPGRRWLVSVGCRY